MNGRDEVTANELSDYLQNKFEMCDDFYIRQVYHKGKELYLAAIANLCDKTYVSDNILRPLALWNGEVTDLNSLYEAVTVSKLKNVGDENDAVSEILSGNALVYTEFGGIATMVSATAKNEDGRSIQEPDSEIVVRGPRQGFVESGEVNVALLRKIIASNELKVEVYPIGGITKTNLRIVYLDGIADKTALDILRKRIAEIPLDSMLDSGYAEQYLQNGGYPFFPEVGNSEKPDKVAAKIIEGRIAVVCDGSPAVLTVPYLFDESLQSSEDYLKTPYYATLMRIIRFIGLMIALYLPAVYVAVLENHMGMMPKKLFDSITESRSDIPFGVFTELIVILLIFELIREVGIRMPKAVGDAVSIVGGIILGDAAIKAGIASEPVIIVAALTAISNFINPPFMNNTVLIRLSNLVAAKFLGLFGVAASVILLFTVLSAKDSFGTPYMYPFAPTTWRGLSDSVILMPKKALMHSTSELRNTKEGEG